MIRYFDASALVKRYAEEPESPAVRRLAAQGRVATSRLSEAEVASALCRRGREGSLPEMERDRALARLEADLVEMDLVELSADVARRARGLLLRHPLRAGDAVQLASGLGLRDSLDAPIGFVAFDAKLRAAAKAEGLAVAP